MLPGDRYRTKFFRLFFRLNSMENKKVKIIGLFAVAALVNVMACSKYKDPPETGLDDRLGTHYCNDPRSVNYNWGFPGIPDNDICIYPIDSFLGTWLFTDSMSRQDGDSFIVQIRTLRFTATEDTALTHLAIYGLCDDDVTPVYVTANQYSVAYVDTLFEEGAGQLFCNSADTLTGFINLSTDTAVAPSGTMIFNLTVSTNEGIIFHRGTAIKQ